MKTPFSLITIAASAAFLFAAAPSRASVIYSQNFESLSSGNLSGQAGFTAGYPTGSSSTTSASVTTSGGLTYTSTNAGAITVPGGNNAVSVTAPGYNNFNLLNSFAQQTGTVYFSIAMTWSNVTSASFVYFALSSSTNGNGTSQAANLQYSGGIALNGFGGSSVGVGGRIRDNDTGPGTMQAAATGSFPGDNAGSTSSTQLIVGSLSASGANGPDYDTFNEWVDPTSLTLGTPNLTISENMGTSSLSYFYLFTGGNDSETVNVDNINIGTTAADVLPAAAIPEPTTWALLLGGGVALLGGSRRTLRKAS